MIFFPKDGPPEDYFAENFQQIQRQNQRQNHQQNHQQNQHQYQQQNQQQNQNPQSFPIAVGPAQEEDITSILDVIRMKLCQRKVTQPNQDLNFESLNEVIYSKDPTLQYFTFFVNDKKLSYSITDIKSIEFRGQTIFISPSEYPIDDIYINFVNSIFPQCLTGNFLDLSNIKNKSRPNTLLEEDSGIDINKNYRSLPFLLFLCSLECRIWLTDVEYISFDNNLLSNPRNLSYFSDFFPSLAKISLSGSKFDDDSNDNDDDDENNNKNKKNQKNQKNQNKNKNKNENDGLQSQLKKLERNEISVSLERQLYPFDFDDPKKFKYYFGHPGFRQPVPPPRDAMPLNDVVVPAVIVNDPNQERKEKMISEMRGDQVIQIHRHLFPTNFFIEKFFAQGKESIQSLYPFYAGQSFFSLIVDKCPPNSPMYFFTQYSTNRLNSQFFYKQPFGSSSVINAQMQVFGPKFNAIVQSVNQSEVTKSAYAIVVHGVFQSCLDGNVYAFDRSFLAVGNQSELGFVIFNDQIFIRRSTLV